ncbi:hypothetical protein [uncultured Novosphingobium sp.]|uniref:hypothetical protein n=1 Tax=uncultured Novosphingobium sp. TaxID=292277 RepID=UPI00258D4299|nr:hypothetical protein [uncultured Novosphingobium sp.]
MESITRRPGVLIMTNVGIIGANGPLNVNGSTRRALPNTRVRALYANRQKRLKADASAIADRRKLSPSFDEALHAWRIAEALTHPKGYGELD